MKMGRNTFIAGFAVLCFLLVAYFWFIVPKNQEQEPLDRNTNKTNELVNSDIPKGSSDTQFEGLGFPTAEENAKAIASREALSRAFKDAFKNPINFYGLVLEESGTPISDVKVSMNWNSPNGSKSAVHYTNAEGMFDLTNAQGRGIQVRIDKQGYIPSPENRLSYDLIDALGQETLIRTSRENPVIFKMRKMGESARLIKRFEKIRLTADGQPKAINLVSGDVISVQSSYADMVFTFTRGPADEGAKEFDWRFKMEIPQGGLIETDDIYVVEAPADGYADGYEIEYSADDPEWQREFKKNFYIMSRNGEIYGYIKFHFTTSSIEDLGAVRITYFVNPEGSRNLEYDKELDVTKKY